MSAKPPQDRARQSVAAAAVAAELLPGQSPALLQELHLLTRSGELNADARRKLKQINHLYGMLRPKLEPLLANHGDPLLLDAGAGNGYLGFVLYDLLLRPAGRGRLVGVESRPDLVERVNQRAALLGFSRLQALQGQLAEWADADVAGIDGQKPQAVLALHACDTATDDALVLGIRAESQVIAVVPCCQAELARLLGGGSAVRSALGPLWRHPFHRREFGAHLTNVVRSLVLEAHGYSVAVTELTGWEHSMKNELILAHKVQRSNGLALQQLRGLLAELPVGEMGLLRRLAATLAPAAAPAP